MPDVSLICASKERPGICHELTLALRSCVYTVQIPNLATLERTPSWVNNNGRIDRCACLELRAAWLRRRAEVWKPAATKSGRISSAIVIVDGAMLKILADRDPGRRLAGEFRTWTANAMRPADRSAYSFRRRLGLTPGVPANSRWHGFRDSTNRGPRRSKLLGLPPAWSQPLRLELWRQHQLHNRAYLICPHPQNCPTNGREDDAEWERRARRRISQRALNHNQNDDQNHNLNDDHDLDSHRFFSSGCRDLIGGGGAWALQGDPRLPRLSTIKRGSKLNMKMCPQRVLKLFAVMCTPAEAADARIAQAWLMSLPESVRLRSEVMPAIARITQRYGLLFHPRRLLCQRCLGVRYNQGSERRRRQYWRDRPVRRPGDGTA